MRSGEEWVDEEEWGLTCLKVNSGVPRIRGELAGEIQQGGIEAKLANESRPRRRPRNHILANVRMQLSQDANADTKENKNWNKRKKPRNK